jgi:peroxiredoxin
VSERDLMKRHAKFFWTPAITLIVLFSVLPVFWDRAGGGVHYMDALGIFRFDEKIKAPNFILKNLRGSEVELADLEGKIVFLNFWATWCPPCRTEMPSMQKLYDEFKDEDFVMLAIDLREKVKKVRSFKERLRLNFPILIDSDGVVSLTYGVRSIPATYLVDREGFLIGGALGARDWASEDSFGLFKKLLDNSPGL